MVNRIKKILLSLVGGRAIGLLRNILVIPVLIKYWGLEYYGEWVMISTIPSILSMTNVGLGTASQIRIIGFLAEQKIKEAANVLLHTIFVVIVFFIILLFLAFIFSYFHTQVFTFVENSNFVILLLSLSYFINLITRSFRGYWIHDGKYAVSANYDNLLGLGELLILAICPILGLKAFVISILNLLLNCVWAFLYAIRSTALFNIKFGFSYKKDIIIELINKGIGFQFSALWQAILFQAPLWVIGLQMSPIYVGIWGSLRAFTRLANQVIEIISLSIGTEFQRLISDKKYEAVSSLLIGCILVSVVVAFIGFIVISVWGGFFYSYWAKIDVTGKVDFNIWFTLGVGLIFFSIWRVTSEVEIALNKPWKMNLIGIVASVLSCIISYLFIPNLGLESIALGSCFFDFVMAIFIPYTVFNRLDLSLVVQMRTQVDNIKKYLINR